MPSRRPPAQPAPRSLLLFLWVALAAGIAFWPILRNGFTYDDFGVVLDNTQLSQLLHPATYFSRFYFVASGESTYRPLVSLSYAIEAALWGKSAPGFHAADLLLHAGVSVLFVAACLSLGAPRAVALVAGLLYATHPLGSEAVCAVGFREDPLCALFYLAAFVAWPSRPGGDNSEVTPPEPKRVSGERASRLRRSGARPAAAPSPASPRLASGRRYVLALVLFALALLSKEMALSFPLLVLAKDLRSRRIASAQGRGFGRGAISWHAVAWAMAGGALVLFLTFHQQDAGFAKVDDAGLARRVASFPLIALRYLGLFCFPRPLSVERLVDLGGAWLWPASLASAAFLGALGVVCFRRRSAFPPAWEAFVAFFLLLGPVSNLIRLDHPMAERYLVLPLAAFCYLLAHAVVRLLAPPYRRAVVAALLVACVLLSWERCVEWRSDRTLWSAEVRRGSRSGTAYANLGTALMAAQELDDAEKLLREAVRLSPAHSEALCNLGAVEEKLGRNGEAEPYLRRAIEVRPDYALAHALLASALAELGRRDAAAAECDLAVRYGAYDAAVCNTVGIVRLLLGDTDEAEKMFRSAVALDSTLYQPLVNLGQILAGRGRYDDGAALYRRALTRQPDGPEALEGLGAVLLNTGHPVEAADLFQRWTRVQPGVARAYLFLGKALLGAKRPDNARQCLEQGLAVARQAGDSATASAVQQTLGTLP